VMGFPGPPLGLRRPILVLQLKHSLLQVSLQKSNWQFTFVIQTRNITIEVLIFRIRICISSKYQFGFCSNSHSKHSSITLSSRMHSTARLIHQRNERLTCTCAPGRRASSSRPREGRETLEHGAGHGRAGPYSPRSQGRERQAKEGFGLIRLVKAELGFTGDERKH
jgi:hypothetical protein